MTEHSTTSDPTPYSEPFSVGRVFLALAVLTAATFASLAIRHSFSDYWTTTTNTLFILLVATAKASLVVLFFMHWRYERSWKFALCIPPAILAIVTVLALMPDIAFDTYPRVTWNGP